MVGVGNCLTSLPSYSAIYSQSQALPTESDHIGFSLLMSLALLAGVVLVFSNELAPWLRQVTIGAIVLLFLFQHLPRREDNEPERSVIAHCPHALAVRSGIVAMYAAGLFCLWWASVPNLC